MPIKEKLHSKNLEFILILALFLTAAFFRLYALRDYVVFLGDEGRDMIILRNTFIKHDLPFLGPTASVGGFYLGPIYYWMAAPFLLLTNFDPVGPSYLVSFLGIATVVLLYKFLKEELGYWPAILASFLYATAPLVVRYSRSSWNPNPMPFFSLLFIFFLYRAIKSKNSLFYFCAGACFGIAIQLHYLALILALIGGGIILINESFKKIAISVFLLILGSLITFSPFLVFEIKNNFPNFKTILEFVTRGNTLGYQGNVINSVASSADLFLQWLTKIEKTVYTSLYLWFSTIFMLTILISNWKTRKKLIFSITFIYFIAGIFFIKLYAGQLNDYYFGIIFPAPFILFASIAHILWEKPLSRYFVITIFLLTLTSFLLNGFYRTPPNRLIEQTNKIASVVIEKTDGKPFNFALISPSNSDHAYRYFLEVKGHKPTQLEESVTDQLIVLCEEKDCKPLGHPLWEIAGFGRAEIESHWYLPEYRIELYKLSHHSSSLEMIGKPAVKGI